MSTLLTCKNCGWVSFAVTRAHAELEVEQFNEYYDTLPKETQELCYGGKKNSIKQYDRCFRCGGSHLNFKIAEDNDCPPGCTISPIIHEPKSE